MTFSMIRRDRETAARVREIMGLPDDRWSDIKVEFGNDEPGTATITFLLTAEQTIALAQLAAMPVADCYAHDPDFPDVDPSTGDEAETR